MKTKEEQAAEGQALSEITQPYRAPKKEKPEFRLLTKDELERWAKSAKSDDWDSMPSEVTILVVESYELRRRVNSRDRLIKDMLAVLEDVEWNPVDNAQGPFCPSCEAWRNWGDKDHTSDCELTMVIKRAEEILK